MADELIKKEKVINRRPVRTFPKHFLEEVLVIARAVQDRNGGNPMKRILVADSIKRKPTSPEFRDLLSSSFKYGLTLGTEKAENISLTNLGQEITRPLNPEMEFKAKIKAVRHPEIFNKIYSNFKDKKFKIDTFFENQLEKQFNVPREYVKEVSKLLEKNGEYAEIIKDISGSPHLIFDELASTKKIEEKYVEEIPEEINYGEEKPEEQIENKQIKVFISHGKNKKILGQIKTMLEFGNFIPVIAEQQETTAIPVPEKIMKSMRECDSAIINISADEMIKDEEGNEGYKINENVLIEVGSAFVLYDTKVILLVDKRIHLPSNLQGIYRSEYEGDELSWDSGMKIQKQLTEFKNSTNPKK